MKVIVFGGSGFLGSHVADCLTEKGYQVSIFDLEPSPYLLPDQKMIIGNILDEQAVYEAVQDQDYIFNFAGIADLDDATTRPIETIKQNIMGSAILLEASRKHGVKRFLYASTIYVYSEKGGFYRCSKQSAELYIEEYLRKYGLNYTVLRFGTLYGQRANNRNSIYNYLRQAIENKQIVCSGTGNEIREYINVKDAARLSVMALDEEYSNKHVIITGSNSMQFKDMLSMINEILGNKISIEFNGMENNNHYNITPYSFVPKAGYKLVGQYHVDMGQGLLECISEIYKSIK
ncbi:MAG TPA: NAD-dependent epimerase [Desulfotomaculum sp.]|nr:MAG: NAD-dependent epimerase/dehydratase [Desulfotomaculum sp. 46_296]HAG10154.1 NAD-dependent epimerase [Desulfotomaculum sp.]HBY03655.1 NAD-dependent epimerase [Desulfotomaculum sp.]